MAIPKISDSSLSTILSALMSHKRWYGNTPTVVTQVEAANTEVQAYSRALAEPRPFATISNEALGAGLHYSFITLDEYQVEKMHRVNAGRWPADKPTDPWGPIEMYSNPGPAAMVRNAHVAIPEEREVRYIGDDDKPVSIQQLAIHRGMTMAADGSYSGAEIAAVGLQLLGGCFHCAATIAACNAYPSKSGYWHCEDCIGDQGYDTVEQANAAIFGDKVGR